MKKIYVCIALLVLFGVVMYSRGGMFGLVYAPEILIAQPERCPKSLNTEFPSPIKTDGILVDDKSGLQALGGGESWDLYNIYMTLKLSGLEYIEMYPKERSDDWLSLAGGQLNGYLKASWATPGDTRCAQYEKYMKESMGDFIKSPKCLAFEIESVPSSAYAVLTTKPNPSDQYTWKWRLIDMKTNSVYAEQTIGGSSQLSPDCRDLAQAENRKRFTALMTQ